MPPVHYAYLIVLCNKETNAIEHVSIWSSPEWEQSRCLRGVHTYVAFRVGGSSFDRASKTLIEAIKEPLSRYYYLLPYIRNTPPTREE